MGLDRQGLQAWLALLDPGAVISGAWRVAFPKAPASASGLVALIEALAAHER